MSFLLDTNICSAHMRRPGGLDYQQYGGFPIHPRLAARRLVEAVIA
jgi:hypothetical protein